MNINLPPGQQAFVEHLVESGRFLTTDEAISACIRLFASRDQLKDEIAIGIEQADQGDVIDHHTVFAGLRTTLANIQRTNHGP